MTCSYHVRLRRYRTRRRRPSAAVQRQWGLAFWRQQNLRLFLLRIMRAKAIESNRQALASIPIAPPRTFYFALFCRPGAFDDAVTKILDILAKLLKGKSQGVQAADALSR